MEGKHAVRPCIRFVVTDNGGHGNGLFGRSVVVAGTLIYKGNYCAGGLVEGDGEIFVLHREALGVRVGLGAGLRLVVASPKSGEPIYGVAERGNIGKENGIEVSIIRAGRADIAEHDRLAVGIRHRLGRIVSANRHLYGERQRIEHDYRTGELACGVVSHFAHGVGNAINPCIYHTGDTQERLVLNSVRNCQCVSHRSVDIIIRLHYRAAAQNIVELVKTDIAPCFFEVLGLVFHSGEL